MKMGFFILSVCVLTFLSGCAFYPSQINLDKVAQDSGLTNITTGDATYGSYSPVGQYSGREIGVAIGFPGSFKLFEIFPVQKAELLLAKVAKRAAKDGADAMINVIPHQEFYSGLPFIFIGIYMDKAEGTGIKANQ